jgi:hypothetical protein
MLVHTSKLEPTHKGVCWRANMLYIETVKSLVPTQPLTNLCSCQITSFIATFSVLPSVCRQAPAAVATSGGVTKRRPNDTMEPKAAGRGVPAPGAPGPAAGESRRHAVRGTYGSLSCRAVLGFGSVHCRSGPVLGGRSFCCPAVRSAHRRLLNRQ